MTRVGPQKDLRERELAAIRMRGPDSSGYEVFHWNGYCASLTHSRLAIIDLSDSSRQPMCEAESGWWITYNGEIYNYPDVRQELADCGWSFQTTGDTEVLLKAWTQWGLDALQRLNGMFAFAALRPATGELWLVRDRFGVKPLVWARLPQDEVVFSSSVAGVASETNSGIDLSYCARGVRYKVYETAGSGSPFSRVSSVPAGSWMKFQMTHAGIDVQSGRWYDLHRSVARCAESIMHDSDISLVERCRHLLEDAVAIRMRSDVPVAVSLSGGLDSSTVAALASKGTKALRGFTYGAPDAPSSEGPDVAHFSETAGVNVTYVWPDFNSESLRKAFERTIAFQEAPFSGLSLIAQNEVYRNARAARFKVLLGGQGGDEIFAGYRKFFFAALREARYKRDTWDTLRLLYSLGMMLMHEAGQARMYWENLHRYSRNADKGFRLLNWQAADEDLWGGPGITLSTRQIEDILQWSLPTLLRYEDRNSMGYGVESRLPFMDYRLVELALSLPPRLKIRNGFGKWALRKMTKNDVPDVIRLNRKKRGFDVTQAWIRQGIGEELRQCIFDYRSVLQDHLRKDVKLDALLSDSALSSDSNLLDEALMLAWMANPVRNRAKADMMLEFA